MTFDPTTARMESSGFDPSTARLEGTGIADIETLTEYRKRILKEPTNLMEQYFPGAAMASKLLGQGYSKARGGELPEPVQPEGFGEKAIEFAGGLVGGQGVPTNAEFAAMLNPAVTGLIKTKVVNPVADATVVPAYEAVKKGIKKIAQPVIESDYAKAFTDRINKRLKKISNDYKIARDVIMEKIDTFGLKKSEVMAGNKTIQELDEQKKALQIGTKKKEEARKISNLLAKEKYKKDINTNIQNANKTMDELTEPIASKATEAKAEVSKGYDQVKADFGDNPVDITPLNTLELKETATQLEDELLKGKIESILNKVNPAPEIDESVKFKLKELLKQGYTPDHPMWPAIMKEYGIVLPQATPMTVKDLIVVRKEISDAMGMIHGAKGKTSLKDTLGQGLKVAAKTVDNMLDNATGGTGALNDLGARYSEVATIEGLFGGPQQNIITIAGRNVSTKKTLQSLFKAKGSNLTGLTKEQIKEYVNNPAKLYQVADQNGKKVLLSIRAARLSESPVLNQAADDIENMLVEFFGHAKQQEGLLDSLKMVGKELPDYASRREIEAIDQQVRTLRATTAKDIATQKTIESLESQKGVLESIKDKKVAFYDALKDRMSGMINKSDWTTLLPIYMAGNFASILLTPISPQLAAIAVAGTQLAFISKWSPSTANLMLKGINALEKKVGAMVNKVDPKYIAFTLSMLAKSANVISQGQKPD